MLAYLASIWSPLLLLTMLLVHRFAAHRGHSDVEAPKGQRPWTTWLLIFSSVLLLTISVTGGWMHFHALILPVAIVGHGLVLSSLLLTAWSRRALGRHFSIYLKADEGHELITEGPYRRVRHPVYTAELLLQVGAPLATCTWEALPLLLVGIWMIRLRIDAEEALLTERYPQYEEYKAVTGRLLPPLGPGWTAADREPVPNRLHES